MFAEYRYNLYVCIMCIYRDFIYLYIFVYMINLLYLYTINGSYPMPALVAHFCLFACLFFFLYRFC